MIISSIRAAAFNIFLKSNEGVVPVYQAPDVDCLYTATDDLFKSMCEKPPWIKIKVEEELEGACIREGLAKEEVVFWGSRI